MKMSGMFADMFLQEIFYDVFTRAELDSRWKVYDICNRIHDKAKSYEFR